MDIEVHRFFTENTIPSAQDFLPYICRSIEEQGLSLKPHLLSINLFLEIAAVSPIFVHYKPSCIACSAVILSILCNGATVNVQRCVTPLLDDIAAFCECSHRLFQLAKDTQRNDPALTTVRGRYFEDAASSFLDDVQWNELQGHFLDHES